MQDKILTRDELIEYLIEHKERFPDKGNYHVEVRDRIVVVEPTILQHDDMMQVIILGGLQHR